MQGGVILDINKKILLMNKLINHKQYSLIFKNQGLPH